MVESGEDLGIEDIKKAHDESTTPAETRLTAVA